MIDARWVAGLLLTNALAVAAVVTQTGSEDKGAERARVTSVTAGDDAPEPFSDGPRCPLCELEPAV